MDSHGLNRAALPADLKHVAQLAERWMQLAAAGLHASRDLTDRERALASALLRNAKGVQTTAAAWLEEIGNK